MQLNFVVNPDFSHLLIMCLGGGLHSPSILLYIVVSFKIITEFYSVIIFFYVRLTPKFDPKNSKGRPVTQTEVTWV